jgi:hypothetical protein
MPGLLRAGWARYKKGPEKGPSKVSQGAVSTFALTLGRKMQIQSLLLF